MASLGDVFLRLLANTAEFERQVKTSAQRSGQEAGQILSAEIARPLSRASSDLGRSLASIGKSLSAAGRGLTTNLTLPIIAAGAAVTHFALDFDTALRKVVGLTDVTEEQIGGIREELLALSTEVGKTPQELAEAFYFVASAGFEAAEAMEVLEVAAKASAAGLGETTTIAQVLGAALNAYGKENLSAVRAADILIEAVSKGTAEASEFAGSLGRIIPIAASMDVPFEEVAGALAAMTLSGLDADEAVTSLRQILVSILKPTAQANQVLEDLGLSAAGLRQQLREQGLIATLRTLEERFSGNAEATAIMFGNVRALTGIQNLLGLSAEQLDTVMSDVADSVGRLNEAYEQTEGPQREIDRAMAQLQVTAIELGADVLPVVVDAVGTLAEGAKGLAAWWKTLDERTRDNIVTWAALAAVLGPLLLVFGKLVTGLGALFKVIGFLLGPTGIPALIVQLKALGVAGSLAAGAIGLLVLGLLEAGKAWSDYMEAEQPVEASFIRLGVQSGKFYDRISQTAVRAARQLGISLEAFKRRVVAFAEATGAGFDDAVAAVLGGKDLVVSAMDGVVDGWEAALRDTHGVEDAAGDVPELVATVLEDGSVEITEAAEVMVSPVEEALEAATQDAADRAEGIIAALANGLAKGPDEIHDEMQAILDALTDPYITAERIIDIQANLMNAAVRDALTSDDPRLEADTFTKINDWLDQWMTIEPAIFEIGSEVAPWLNEGINSTLQTALDWVVTNVTGPYEDKFMLADVLEQLGYDGLAAFVRGTETARLNRLAQEQALLQAQMDRKFQDIRTSAYGWGYGTGTSYGDGLQAAQGYINDKARQIRDGVQRYLEFAGSPPYTESRQAGEMVMTTYFDGLLARLRALLPDLGAAFGGLADIMVPTLAPATVAPIAPTVVPAGPSTVNNYNLNVTGRLDVDEARDALEEMRRLEAMSLRSGG